MSRPHGAARRRFLRASALLLAPTALAGCSGELQSFKTWRYAREAVLELLFGEPRLHGNAQWNLVQMLQHTAQSIEFSVRGFPELKPAWFRATAGAVAWSWFDARGAMSHSLDEPIPGAAALDPALALKVAVQRLLDAMEAFSSHQGAYAPHFAYGELTRAQYERAHLMHLANHWQQLKPLA